MPSTDVTIVGAGSWGRALAHTLLINKKKILMYSRNTKDKKYECKNINVLHTNEIQNVFNNNAPIVIATPVSSLKGIGSLINKYNYSGPIILACKGIDSALGLFPTQILSQSISENNLAVVSGPTFAAEVLKNKPTAVTIASKNTKILKLFTNMFHSKYFRVYASNDLIGCQLGGAMKNILSIAVGISDGLKLGANAKAAIISRGMIEIKALGEILECDENTIYGLSGLGDLVLTSNDDLSRNRRFGLAIAEGLSILEAEKKIGFVVEGIYASKGLNILMKKHSLNLPICNKVFDIINGKISADKAVSDLLTREQKKEFV